MGRRRRHVRQGGSMVEVTNRTLHGRFLLRPSKDLNEIALGVVGRAQRLYRIELFGLVIMSNHFHLLAWADEFDQLSDFMEYMTGNLSWEVARLVNWPEKIFPRRYQGIVVSDERRAQEKRLKYLLSQGVKESLVEEPEKWPGVNSVKALCYGTELRGYWYNRTLESAARRRGERFPKRKYATEEKVVLSPLPCWEGDSEKEVRARVRKMVREITEKAAAKRKKKRIRVLGAKAIKEVHPHTRPENVKSSPAPDFHAVDEDILRDLRKGYRDFCNKYSERSKAVRGHRHNEWGFPAGCYPSPPPYVPSNFDPGPDLEAVNRPRSAFADGPVFASDVRDRGDPPAEPTSVPEIALAHGTAIETANGAAIRLPDDAHPE